MKLFFLPLTLLTLNAYAGAPDCTALGNIVSDMEADLQKQSFKNCQSVRIEDFIKEGPIDDQIKTHFLDYRCKPMGSLESEITRLETQLATLRGLQEFSKDLAKKNDLLKAVPTAEKLKEETVKQGRKFQSGLKTAYTLEKILSLKSNELLLKIKERAAGGDLSGRDFDVIYADVCPKADYCKELDEYKDFLKDDAVIKELGSVFKGSPLDAQAIDGMKAALSITDQEGKALSYGAIIDVLEASKVDLNKINTASGLDRNLIKALKQVPSFKAGGNLSFLAELSKAKDSLSTKATIDSFKYLSEDVQIRNAATLKSKLSAVLFNIDKVSKLDQPTKDACQKLFDPATKPEICLTALETLSPSLGSAYEDDQDTISALRSLADSNKKISDFNNICLDEQLLINNTQQSSGPNSLKDCSQSFISEEGILSKKLTALNLLRSKLLSENTKLQDFRNFAIQKLDENTCKQTRISSVISDCGGISMENITPSIDLLTGDILKVAVAFTPKDEADISSYCEDEKIKKSNSESRLCEFLDENTLPNTAVGSPTDTATAPIDIEDSRADRDARKNAIAAAVNNIAGAMGRQYQTPYNPYNYYNPYGSNIPPMTISDSLTYNSVFYGGYSGYYPMNNASPFVYNSQVLKYTGLNTGTSGLFSYSAAGGSSYGPTSFMPSFKFD